MVAGTVNCGSFAQVGESQLQRLRDHPVDGEAVGLGIDRRGPRQVLAHKEDVDGGDPGIEVADRRFQVFRPVVVQDHGPLAGDGGAVRGFELGGGRRGQECEDLTPVWLHRSYRLIYWGRRVQAWRVFRRDRGEGARMARQGRLKGGCSQDWLPHKFFAECRVLGKPSDIGPGGLSYRVSVTLVRVRGLSGSRPFWSARQAAKICAGTM